MNRSNSNTLYGIEHDWLSPRESETRFSFRYLARVLAAIGLTSSVLVGTIALSISERSEMLPSISPLNDREIDYIEAVVSACKDAQINIDSLVTSHMLSKKSNCAELAINLCLHIRFESARKPKPNRESNAINQIGDFVCQAAHVVEVSELGYILRQRYGPEKYVEFIELRRSLEIDVQFLMGLLHADINRSHQANFFKLTEELSEKNFDKLEELAETIQLFARPVYGDATIF